MRGISGLLLPLLACTQRGYALTADEHIEKGGQSLKAGDFSSALDHYHSACDKDPNAYLNFYKRATVYLATGRSRQASKDLAKVLELKPSFKEARTRLADIKLKDGSYAAATAQYTELKNTGKNQYEAELLKIETASQQYAKAQQLHAAKDHVAAIDLFTQALEVSPNSEPMRRMRAESYMATGQNGEAIGDVTRATKLKSGNVEAYFLLAKLQFQVGDRAEGLKQIRECVKLDADHKAAFDFYKMLKKFNKLADKVADNMKTGRHAEGIKNIEKLRKIDSTTYFYADETNTQLCTAYLKQSKVAEAQAACEAGATLNPKNIEIILLQAEISENEQEYQAAIDHVKRAMDIEENSQRLKDKKNRYEKLLKQSLRRDYYKILGLPRNCDKKAISKAYRALAQQWHPDKFSGEEEKAAAEKKFMDIASAKEVLSDPNKRQIFDDGEDPLDAEQNQQRQQGGHGFPGGFPFGGGGGGQQFHFRR